MTEQIERPPVLSGDKIYELSVCAEGGHYFYNEPFTQDLLQAQRDADVDWYQESKCGHCDTPLLREGELYQQIKQAKAKTAERILKEIEGEYPFSILRMNPLLPWEAFKERVRRELKYEQNT